MESAWQYFVQAVHREEVSFLKIDSRLHQLIPLNLKQLHTLRSQVIQPEFFNWYKLMFNICYVPGGQKVLQVKGGLYTHYLEVL